MHSCRLIGPAEYDTVAAKSPSLCPLVAMGDLRSGQQVEWGPLGSFGAFRARVRRDIWR